MTKLFHPSLLPIEIFRNKELLQKMHPASYFLLIDPSTNQLLLVDHKKANLWLPSGGHVEKNEHPKETVKREAIEELGIASKPV